MSPLDSAPYLSKFFWVRIKLVLEKRKLITSSKTTTYGNDKTRVEIFDRFFNETLFDEILN